MAGRGPVIFEGLYEGKEKIVILLPGPPVAKNGADGFKPRIF